MPSRIAERSACTINLRRHPPDQLVQSTLMINARAETLDSTVLADRVPQAPRGRPR